MQKACEDIERWIVAMARSLRVEYAVAYYHVMARSSRNEEIFAGETPKCVRVNSSSRPCLISPFVISSCICL